jgi:glycosyltransferase involved in cell wall biosynthesis
LITRSPNSNRALRIFTPSFADEANTNAQNLTVKEIVSRLPPDQFHVTMISAGNPDPRIAARNNTSLIRWTGRGNTVRMLRSLLVSRPDIYFFPRCGPFDRGFFDLRRVSGMKTALVSYIVMMMNDATSAGLIGRSITDADKVCANSRYVASTVWENFGIDPILVHDGVDRRFFYPAPAKLAAGNLTVLYAGSFQPRKRVEILIQHAVRWPEVKFRLAGRGETEAMCREASQDRRCSNVEFLGHLSPAELGNEMRAADVFLFPSVLEGHPQVLIQAAACGLPSIAMKLYQPDAVVDRETGFLVESDRQLAACLDDLLQSENLRRSMASAAVCHARRFDWDRIANQWAEIFCDVVTRRNPIHLDTSNTFLASYPH